MTDKRGHISIRPLRPEDYDVICDLWASAGLQARLTGRDAREAYLAQLEQFPTTYLGAEADGRLVGVVLGTHDFRRGWINRLAVRPDCQGRGVARALLEACENALRECGIEIHCALIEGGNETSRKAFERCGYVEFLPVHYYRKRDRPDI
jgi:ribosomal protein S18 acetylase RimI-like enzyme